MDMSIFEPTFMVEDDSQTSDQDDPIRYMKQIEICSGRYSKSTMARLTQIDQEVA